jgi:hypothetical protein
MSVLIRSGDAFYEIPDELFEKCRVPEKQFERGVRETSNPVATEIPGPDPDDGNFLDLTDCAD